MKHPALILLLLFFLASCAPKQVSTVPRSHLPPENIPQIGTGSPGAAPPAQKPVRLAALETLIKKAKTQLDRNRPEAAFTTLERALSVDGQDPEIWHLMARVRFLQGRYSQALSLAKKSNTLAWNRPELKEKNSQLIDEARKGLERDE
ncbi:MAG: tetratricopeptide repeat protein [Desulfobacterales bacterium]|nr:tetratricopeptide repeat protein [Desulfobacterales bacterium]